MTDPSSRAAASDDAAAMAGWAQLLYDVVERRLRPVPGTDLLAPSWDTQFDDALAEVMRAMLRSRLERLTPEEFVVTYRSLGGDTALLGELDRLVAARAEVADRDVALVRLQHEATVAGRLPLTALAVGETLDVSLFDPIRPDLAAAAFRDDAARRPLHRVLRLRIEDPAGGVRVVSDTWVGAVWAERWRTPPVPAMTPARAGTRLPESGEVAPELTLHAPVTLEPYGGDALQPPGIVGDVRTLDGRLLLGSPTRRGS